MYILKPIDTLDLERAVNNVYDTWKRNRLHKEKTTPASKTHKKITLHFAEGFHIIDPSHVVRLEADNTYTTIYMDNNKSIVSSKPIHEFDDLLEEDRFVRIHRSHIVNLDFVREFNKKYDKVLILSTGEKIPIARRKLNNFQSCLQYYIESI